MWNEFQERFLGAPWIAILSTALWFGIQIFFDHIAEHIFPKQIKWLKDELKKQNIETYQQIRTRAVCFVFCVTAVTGSFYQLLRQGKTLPDLLVDLHVEDSGARAMGQWAIGYFFWDLIVTLIEGWGPAMLFHAVFCLYVYVGSQWPFSMWIGVCCLLFDFSGPFLHTFFTLKALGRHSGWLWNVSSYGFPVAFLLARLVWGIPLSYYYCSRLIAAISQCSFSSSPSNPALCQQYSFPFYLSFLVSNLLLTFLNCFWFSHIVRSSLKILKQKREQ